MERWRFATWNVGSMTGRGRELAEEMGRRSIDVMCVQETKCRAAKELGGGYKIFYSDESKEMEWELLYHKDGRIMSWK